MPAGDTEQGGLARVATADYNSACPGRQAGRRHYGSGPSWRCLPGVATGSAVSFSCHRPQPAWLIRPAAAAVQSPLLLPEARVACLASQCPQGQQRCRAGGGNLATTPALLHVLRTVPAASQNRLEGRSCGLDAPCIVQCSQGLLVDVLLVPFIIVSDPQVARCATS